MNKMLSEKNKRFFLQLAREAITKNSGVAFDNPIPPIAEERHGVFVTIHVNGQLRGCIGSLLPNDTVHKSIIHNAINAAYHDYRFPSLSKPELDKINIEISILSDPVLLNCIDSNQLLKKLNHDEGVILRQGRRMAIFLPQVWEKIPDKEDFLMQLCYKAGLNPFAWKESNIEVYAYKVEKFEG
ncbi:MAG: AmmeMemoRadiSam system protein A [Nanoarchaeota archaeon]